jgi:penicillin-binding protein 3
VSCSENPRRKALFRGACIAVLATLLCLAAGCRGDAAKPEAAAEAFLAAWAAGEYEAMYAFLDHDSRETYDRDYFTGRYSGISREIGLRSINTVLGDRLATGDTRNLAGFSFSVQLHTDTVGMIPVENTITLTREDQGSPWLVQWYPGLIFPELTGGRRVHSLRLVPRRGSIYDRYGQTLAGYRSFTEVRAVPGRFSDRAAFVGAVAELLGISPGTIEAKLNQSWVREGLYVPLAILDPVQEALVPELLRIPGVQIDYVERRYYPAGEALAHVIGYLGELTAEELPEKRELGYDSGDRVGRMGLEEALEHVLSGTIGFTIRILEEDGSAAAILAAKEMRPGEDITLTIDLALQQAAAAALAGKTGAVVAMDPDTGEILAMVNSPAFDPNRFIAGLSAAEWQALQDDPRRPFLNRAIWGLYPPGSAFKAITAAAALDAGVFDPHETVRIVGESWQPSPSWGSYAIKRYYTTQTLLDLNAAMRFSDNIYFARLGLELGPDLFEDYGDRYGFAGQIPFTLPVAASRLSRDGITSEILLADSSFGQGEILVTPLHLALIYVSFASRDGLPQPRLRQAGDPGPLAWKEAPVGPSVFETVHRSLLGAAHGAAGIPADSRVGFAVAGKTGTAEVQHEAGNICWYAAYAPAAAPRIVVTVMVEGGEWGSQDAMPPGLALLEFFLSE